VDRREGGGGEYNVRLCVNGRSKKKKNGGKVELGDICEINRVRG